MDVIDDIWPIGKYQHVFFAMGNFNFKKVLAMRTHAEGCEGKDRPG